MNNKEYAKKLEKRTLDFAIKIIFLSSKLPNSPEGKVIKNQLTKASNSIGANYREANRSRSKADLKNKIKIFESESSETQYWLEIIYSLNWLDEDDIRFEINESAELLALFTSIGSKLKFQN